MTDIKTPIIQLRDVVKAYETGEGPFYALKDVNIDIQPGEFLGITGKSGAGKTTLLNMISGVSDLTSGEVRFNRNGTPDSATLIHTLNEDKLAGGVFRSLIPCRYIRHSRTIATRLREHQTQKLPL